MDDLKNLLQGVQTLWEKQIALCKETKERQFGRTAAEIMKFVGRRYKPIFLEPKIDGTHESMGDNEGEFTAVYNMTDAFVAVMAPYVFSQVHDFLVSPRRPQMPPELAALVPQIAEQQKTVRIRDTMTSFLLQWCLNFFPKLYNLEHEGRMVVEEALAKGRGTIWIEMEDGPTGKVPAAYADSVDHLLIDADCKQLREAGFIIREVHDSLYKIAADFQEDVDFLRGHAVSQLQNAVDQATHGDENDGREISKKDIGKYYRVWSRIGLGHKLVTAPSEMKKNGKFFDAMEQIGPYVHFAIMPGMKRPLGMKPSELLGEAGIAEEAQAAGSREQDSFSDSPLPAPSPQPSDPKLLATLTEKLKWPIATYGNVSNPWPVKCLDFKPNVKDPWAKSPLEAALPLQEAMDRVYQTIITRVQAAGRNILLTSSALEKAVNDALQSLDDLPIVKVLGTVSKEEVDKLLHFIEFPPMNKDVLSCLGIFERAFRELTGMNEAESGSNPQTQERSAEASKLKGSGMNRRPDDYAKRTEVWMSDVGAACGIATRLLVDHTTVAPLFGEDIQNDPLTGQEIYGFFTQAFIQYIQVEDSLTAPYEAATEYSYEVAAGSGQPKNLQLYQANADRMWTMFGTASFAGAMQTGDFQPWVELATLVGDAYRMPIQAFLDAFVRMGQTQVMMQQQMMQGAGQGAGSEGQGAGNLAPRSRPPAPGPESPAAEAKALPGGQSINTSWMKAATTPHPQGLPTPPQAL